MRCMSGGPCSISRSVRPCTAGLVIEVIIFEDEQPGDAQGFRQFVDQAAQDAFGRNGVAVAAAFEQRLHL